MTNVEDLQIHCVADRKGLRALEPEWAELLRDTEVASPFLTPGWQAAWLDAYGQDRRLHVLVARRATALIGLWPLSSARRGPFRVLEPIGAGRSDWLDILAIPSERAQVIEGFANHLAHAKADWDLLECRDVLETSPSISILEQLSRSGVLRVRRELRTFAPYLTLPASWEAYLGAKGANFRSSLKKKHRLAAGAGSAFSIRRQESWDDHQPIDDLAQVELRSWKARGGNIKIGTARGGQFYKGFMAYFAARGELDLWRAELDGRLIAFMINVRFGTKCYHYNSCFDERFATISPGLLLHADAIRDGVGRGLGEYDFLSGDEPYKERWSSGKRAIFHLAVYSSRPRSLAAFAALVASRWAYRRSPTLRWLRARLLMLVRMASRRRAG